MLIIIVFCALLLDFLIGEPRKFHPLVGFGNFAIWFEQQLSLPPFESQASMIIKGCFAVFILVSPFVIFSYYLAQYIDFYWLVDILVLYWAIGHQSLRKHAFSVLEKLQDNDSLGSRQALAMIVSRNTEQLDDTQITQATIETVLENGSDAIFAPIFWFCFMELLFNLGAPAVIAYRLINTLDAMWGYKNERYLYFGRTAARLDDALNYIPARLVALSYAVLGNTKLAMQCWKNQASLLKSPNAGPVMVAGAGSLNLCLGGPTYYHQVYTEKPYFGSEISPTLSDIKRSLDLVCHTVILWFYIIALSYLLLIFFAH